MPIPPTRGRTVLHWAKSNRSTALGLESKQLAEFLMFLSLRWRQKEKCAKQPYQGFRGRGRSLTSTPDVDQQISLENCASLQHLCWRDRVNGLRFPILTNLGARPLARAAEHAVRKEGDIESEQWCATESTDCFELNFGRYFPLKLRQILQARMKAAILVQDTLACCTAEQAGALYLLTVT